MSEFFTVTSVSEGLFPRLPHCDRPYRGELHRLGATHGNTLPLLRGESPSDGIYHLMFGRGHGSIVRHVSDFFTDWLEKGIENLQLVVYRPQLDVGVKIAKAD